MKKIKLILFAMTFAFFSTSFADTPAAASSAPEATKAAPKAGKAAKKSIKKGKAVANNAEEVAVLETSMGTIKIKFFPEKAPNHVKNFKELAAKGFYSGTTFHRVIPGFMIQGGDPNTKEFPNDRSKHGMGGPGKNVNAEFNDIKHERGIVSMARAQDPNSAGSQFFIVVKDSFFLDKQYTVFGKVIEGMDVADKIVNAPRDPRDNPNDRIEIKKVTMEAAKSEAPKATETPKPAA